MLREGVGEINVPAWTLNVNELLDFQANQSHQCYFRLFITAYHAFDMAGANRM